MSSMATNDITLYRGGRMQTLASDLTTSHPVYGNVRAKAADVFDYIIELIEEEEGI